MPIGRPPVYDADFHPEECMRLGREGYFAVEMADEWDISVETINDWAREHIAFSLAYARAKQYRAAWIQRKIKDGILTDKNFTFNAQAAAMMLKYDGVQLDERLISMPKLVRAKTFTKQCEIVLKEFSEKKISYKEANAILDMIGKMAKIDEVTEMRKKLEEIELARKQGR